MSYPHQLWMSNQCWFLGSPHRISQAIRFALTFYRRIKQDNELVAIKYLQTGHCSFFGAFSESDQEPGSVNDAERPGSGANQEEKDHLDFCNRWNAWSILWRRSREAINDGITLDSIINNAAAAKLDSKSKSKNAKSCALIATLSWYCVPPPSPEALPLEARTWGRCTYWSLKQEIKTIIYK